MTHREETEAEVLAYVSQGGGRSRRVDGRTVYPTVYPGLIDAGALEVLSLRMNRAGEYVPGAVRLTEDGEVYARHLLRTRLATKMRQVADEGRAPAERWRSRSEILDSYTKMSGRR